MPQLAGVVDVVMVTVRVSRPPGAPSLGGRSPKSQTRSPLAKPQAAASGPLSCMAPSPAGCGSRRWTSLATPAPKLVTVMDHWIDCPAETGELVADLVTPTSGQRTVIVAESL